MRWLKNGKVFMLLIFLFAVVSDRFFFEEFPLLTLYCCCCDVFATKDLAKESEMKKCDIIEVLLDCEIAMTTTYCRSFELNKKNFLFSCLEFLIYAIVTSFMKWGKNKFRNWGMKEIDEGVFGVVYGGIIIKLRNVASDAKNLALLLQFVRLLWNRLDVRWFGLKFILQKL